MRCLISWAVGIGPPRLEQRLADTAQHTDDIGSPLSVEQLAKILSRQSMIISLMFVMASMFQGSVPGMAMIFQTPPMSFEEVAALRKIEELRRQLRFRVAQPRRWVGLVRRVLGSSRDPRFEQH